jgi:hypothetical protein
MSITREELYAWRNPQTTRAAGALIRKVITIVKEREGAVPTLVQRREEAEKKWQSSAHDGKKRAVNVNGKNRCGAAPKRLRPAGKQLLALVDDWSLARSIDNSLRMQNVAHRAGRRPNTRRSANGCVRRVRRSAASTRPIDFTSGNRPTSAAEKLVVSPGLATRSKTDTHVIHARPCGRCVWINVYREKEMVAGAGFEPATFGL